jgi:iron complex outermembrane recepter protein
MPAKLATAPTFRFIDELTTCIVADTPPVLGAVTNDTRCTTDAREILDVTTSYKLNIGSGEVKFSLFARNLLDDRGISSTLPVAGLFTFSGVRPPRQFGGEISFKF